MGVRYEFFSEDCREPMDYESENWSIQEEILLTLFDWLPTLDFMQLGNTQRSNSKKRANLGKKREK